MIYVFTAFKIACYVLDFRYKEIKISIGLFF